MEELNDSCEPKEKKSKKSRQRGCIRQVGADKYRVRICIGKNEVTGKFEYDDRTINGKWKDAERLRAGIVRDLDLGIYAPPSDSSLNEHFAEWLCAKRRIVSARTVDGYEGHFKRYIREKLGKKLLVSLKPSEIQALYDELYERGLSPTTIRHTHVTLKSVLKYAVQLRKIPFNPAEPVKVAKIEHKEKRVLSAEEGMRFLEIAAEMPNGLIFETALLTGMRSEEYLGIKWTDIDFNRRTIVVQRALVIHKGKINFEKPKTNKSRRTIPIPLTLVAKLMQHKRRQLEIKFKAGSLWQNYDLVFCSDIGTPLQNANLTYRYYRPILEKAGLPRIRLYDLRHSLATILLEADENPKVVSERMGHSSIRLTLDTYSHVLPTMQERVTEKLEKILYGGGELSHKRG